MEGEVREGRGQRGNNREEGETVEKGDMLSCGWLRRLGSKEGGRQRVQRREERQGE